MTCMRRMLSWVAHEKLTDGIRQKEERGLSCECVTQHLLCYGYKSEDCEVGHDSEAWDFKGLIYNNTLSHREGQSTLHACLFHTDEQIIRGYEALILFSRCNILTKKKKKNTLTWKLFIICSSLLSGYSA